MFLRILAARIESITGPSSMALPEFTSIIFSIKSSAAQTAPPTVSEVPLINLVSEWITTSAPIFAGEKIIGVKVLSTTNLILLL